jgi:hypothetical protein
MMMDSWRPKWFFYPAWVALSAISTPIAAAIAWLLVAGVETLVGGTIQVAGQTRITEDYLSSYILLPALGLLAGFLQYLLLRRHLPRMRWWIVATVAGLLLGHVGGRLLYHPLHGSLRSTWFAVLMTLLIGASVGIAQWLVLRQRVRHAIWWVLANAVGWGVVGWGAATLSNEMVIPAVGILLAPGIATSIALWLLLDRLPRREGSGRNPMPGRSPVPMA